MHRNLLVDEIIFTNFTRMIFYHVHSFRFVLILQRQRVRRETRIVISGFFDLSQTDFELSLNVQFLAVKMQL